jgi:hypothetical protein
MRTLSTYPSLYIGMNNDEKIYLSAPSWDCGWYWGFGYLGNRNCHYHVNDLNKHEEYNFEKKCFEYEFTNLFDGFKKHFGNTLIVRDSQLWILCELFKTVYSMKESAEVFGSGGSHYTTNPAKDIILNKEITDRINGIILPALFEEIYKILIPAQENPETDKKLLSIILEGDTLKVLDFMNLHNIKTDDLKNITGITNTDFNVIHSEYCKQYHAKAKELKK